MRALHAEAKSESWAECRGRVSSEFNGNAAPSSITLIPSILEKVPVLLFAGDQDFICNYMGIESLIQGMTWSGATGLGVSRHLLLFCHVAEACLLDCEDRGILSARQSCWDVGVFSESHLCQSMCSTVLFSSPIWAYKYGLISFSTPRTWLHTMFLTQRMT